MWIFTDSEKYNSQHIHTYIYIYIYMYLKKHWREIGAPLSREKHCDNETRQNDSSNII